MMLVILTMMILVMMMLVMMMLVLILTLLILLLAGAMPIDSRAVAETARRRPEGAVPRLLTGAGMTDGMGRAPWRGRCSTRRDRRR